MKKNTSWKLLSLPIDRIEIKNSQFNWFPTHLEEKEYDSISRNVFRLPILVHEAQESKYILVDGFKRLKFFSSSSYYLKKNNFNIKIPCIVIPKKVKFFEVVMIRIETLSNTKINMSGLEVCSLLKLLRKKEFPNNEIIENVLPKLGLESSTRLLNHLIKMADILKKFEEKNSLKYSEFLNTLSCEDLISIHIFSDKEILYVLKFFAIIKVRGKKLRYLLKELNEICRFRGSSAREILGSNEFNEILTKQNLQISERYNLIRKNLNSMRYPKLNALREKFALKHKNLNLPERITLDCDNFFEDENLILTMEFASLKELKEHLKFLELISNGRENFNKTSVWEDLFSLLR